MLPRLLPQLDQLQTFPLRVLISTIHIFFRWQQTIFPHTFSPQLFRWRYILNVFPCVKHNSSIHIFSTTSRVIYPSRFSVCVFCVLIFRSYCNLFFRMISRNACALIFRGTSADNQFINFPYTLQTYNR